MPWLPMWRGLASRGQEIAVRKGESVVTVTEFIELLPGHEQGYDESFRAAQELCLPMNKSYEPAEFRQDWYEARHQLRRESLGELRANPFAEMHTKSPEELKDLLPEKVKGLMRWCEIRS